MAGAVSLAAACAAPVADASSRSPADPGEVAGRWTLTLDGRACRIELTATPSAHGYRASRENGCPAPVAQWRPIPDGLELAGADGLTLILLQPEAAGAYTGRDAARRPARLTR